jgi:hypothetical protein
LIWPISDPINLYILFAVISTLITPSEINPRQPVDSAIHVIDLKTGLYERVEGEGEVPQARVGHVAGVINNEIYIFGGVCSMSDLKHAVTLSIISLISSLPLVPVG